MTYPTFNTVPNVPRLDLDDYYETGVAEPSLSKDSGKVVSIEGESLTVDMTDGVIVSGVVMLGGIPTQGQWIEIEKRGDLWVTYAGSTEQAQVGAAFVNESAPPSSVRGLNLGGSMRDRYLWFQPARNPWEENWGEDFVRLVQQDQDDFTMLLASTEVFDVQPADVIETFSSYQVHAGVVSTIKMLLILSPFDEAESTLLPDDETVVVVEDEILSTPGIGSHSLSADFVVPDTVLPPGNAITERINLIPAPRSESGVQPWVVDAGATLTAGAEGWYSLRGDGIASILFTVAEAGDYHLGLEYRNGDGSWSVTYGDAASGGGVDGLLGTTRTLSAGNHTVQIAVNSGASLDFRNLIVEKDSSGSPEEYSYFDGSYPGYEWIGDEWQSQSRRPYRASDSTPKPPIKGRLAIQFTTPIDVTAQDVSVTGVAASVQRFDQPVGSLWWKPSTNTLSIWDGSSWTAIN